MKLRDVIEYIVKKAIFALIVCGLSAGAACLLGGLAFGMQWIKAKLPQIVALSILVALPTVIVVAKALPRAFPRIFHSRYTRGLRPGELPNSTRWYWYVRAYHRKPDKLLGKLDALQKGLSHTLPDLCRYVHEGMPTSTRVRNRVQCDVVLTYAALSGMSSAIRLYHGDDEQKLLRGFLTQIVPELCQGERLGPSRKKDGTFDSLEGTSSLADAVWVALGKCEDRGDEALQVLDALLARARDRTVGCRGLCSFCRAASAVAGSVVQGVFKAKEGAPVVDKETTRRVTRKLLVLLRELVKRRRASQECSAGASDLGNSCVRTLVALLEANPAAWADMSEELVTGCFDIAWMEYPSSDRPCSMVQSLEKLAIIISKRLKGREWGVLQHGVRTKLMGIALQYSVHPSRGVKEPIHFERLAHVCDVGAVSPDDRLAFPGLKPKCTCWLPQAGDATAVPVFFDGEIAEASKEGLSVKGGCIKSKKRTDGVELTFAYTLNGARHDKDQLGHQEGYSRDVPADRTTLPPVLGAVPRGQTEALHRGKIDTAGNSRQRGVRPQWRCGLQLRPRTESKR